MQDDFSHRWKLISEGMFSHTVAQEVGGKNKSDYMSGILHMLDDDDDVKCLQVYSPFNFISVISSQINCQWNAICC